MKHPLFSSKRLHPSSENDKTRSPFTIDYHKIAFSDAFRTLQDKTQVHSQNNETPIRSRLTHSHEVACVGKTIGNSVAKIFLETLGDTETHPNDVGDITAAACLMHDIGNPPYGHQAEKIMSEFFKREKDDLKEKIPDHIYNQYTSIEGNAQGFKKVVRTAGWNPETGLNLTVATLAGFTKYPFTLTSQKNTDDTPEDEIHPKKYGILESEREIFEKVAEETGLEKIGPGEWKRHPIAYLVECADDICYHIADIEDAALLGIISYEEAAELLIPIAEPQKEHYAFIEEDHRKIIYLRGKAIRNIVEDIISLAEDQSSALISGNYDGNLLQDSVYFENLKNIRSFSELYIYQNESSLAEKILPTLLEKITKTLKERESFNHPLRNKYLTAFPEWKRFSKKRDLWIPEIIDYIGSQTDTSLRSLYKKITSL